MVENKALTICKKDVRLKSTPKYVKLQMREFIKIAEGKDKKYMISERKLKQMEDILKILIMPKGLKAGQTLYNCTTRYQWLFYTAILCTVYRDNPDKRRYEIGVLEICRKNFKTYTIATLFIILFLTEPNFSKFYSVAPDGSLSREVREAISETIRSSPILYEWKNEKRFKILRDYIMFKPTQTQYIPLSYSTSRMDGKLPNVFIADEVGALPISYPIEAMKSGQLNILNKLGFIISTKYPTIDNPFEDEVAYSKKVLDGLEKDETRFSLLYEPDNKKDWQTDDLILKQSNPVALEIPEIWDDLLKKRSYAIAVESARENFVTKHCNIIYQGVGTETYIDVKDVQECRTNKIDWKGRVVYVGLDLSETNDNTSVAMVSVDENNNVLAEVFAFVPEGRIEEKTVSEKVNYRELLKTEKVIACGDRTIDYAVVENFIMDLEKKYGVEIQAIGYDRWNALSTAQKLERGRDGEHGYNCVEIRQHSSVLHPPTKLLKEKILNKEFYYTRNRLLEINFQNAKCVYDTNKNQYVNKKKSKGKVDMVVSLINAMYLLQQDFFLNQMDFTIQVL
jgi:phage terminase large subunit-like protein